jgi:hypothetical protein
VVVMRSRPHLIGPACLHWRGSGREVDHQKNNNKTWTWRSSLARSS